MSSRRVVGFQVGEIATPLTPSTWPALASFKSSRPVATTNELAGSREAQCAAVSTTLGVTSAPVQ